ncbi:uncharacterized protein BXZ73DRAFT_53322, partial [Epithele typhae]|uniref:uncharacterized protein n=1 Tax=Epithele typhae TaxID=378194 RepID=UPI0020075804
LSTISARDLSILKNSEIIAINQDPVVGKAVQPFRWGGNRPFWTFNAANPAQFWSGQTQNGTINTGTAAANMAFSFYEVPSLRLGRQYSVRDLWTHTNNGTAVRSFTARAVPAHGVVALLLQDAGDEPANSGPACADPAVTTQCSAGPN